MNKVVSRAKIMLLLVIILAAGTLFFVGEYIFRAETWVMSPGSPHVYNKNAGCGQITDRDDILLLDTTGDRVYTENEVLRKAIIHWLGDREGNISAPLLPHYADKVANYDIFSGVYGYGGVGGQVKLSLSAKLQMAALEAMGNKKGTVAVYNYKTGEILCAVSTPAFDPDNLPDIAGDTIGQWSGAYVNRFMKSAYTPGSIFKLVTAAAALETIPDIQQQTFTCNGETVYNELAGDKVTCLAEHGEITFQEALTYSCNCAFAQIADQLGGETLQRYAQQFQITESLSFDGMTTVEGNVTAAGEAPVMVAWSAIGQHKDMINPCRYLTFMGAIAGDGVGVEPHLVNEISGGSWKSYAAKTVTTGRIMSVDTAQELQKMMRANVENYYGDENFAGLTVCAKSGTAEVGGDKKPNTLFCGFATDEEYPLAFIVVVEEGESGRRTCIPILTQVLGACKEALDEF
ncbi:MAG: penicillin-binding protein [Oscillospiraceae bacterium]|nr:penicillin-binding protein [Oscillospiraceae bacterium]